MIPEEQNLEQWSSSHHWTNFIAVEDPAAAGQMTNLKRSAGGQGSLFPDENYVLTKTLVSAKNTY